MRGAEAFTEARLAGKRITRVNIDCFHALPARTQGNIIDVEPGDVLDDIDLRFVAGLTVQIGGDDHDRKLEVFDRVVQQHPRFVITLLRDCAVTYTHGEGVRWAMFQD